MAKRYDGRDSVPWKVVDYSGKVLRDSKGKPLQGFDGYKSAKQAAFGVEGASFVRM